MNEELTIVLPAWNEEAVIAGVLRELLGTPGLEQAPVLVVDDGSSDGTVAAVLRVAAEYPRVHVESVPHGGKDLALWHAFRTVRTPWMGLMDADGQYDPADFPLLHRAALEGGAAACWGMRTRRSDHPWRLLCSRVARAVKRRALGRLSVDDPGCGIWVGQARFLVPVANGLADPAGQVHCHLAELIVAQGGAVTQRPINHRSRAGGHAKFGMLNRLGPGSRSLRQARQLVDRLKPQSLPA